MKRIIKDGVDLCSSAGFDLNHDDRKLRKDRWLFTHANEPETVVKFDTHMSELAARTQIAVAKRVLGLATNEAREPRKAKANQREKAERAAERKRRESAQLLAEARRAERVAAQESARIASRRRELDRLMRGGEAPTNAAVRADAMLTIAQVADQTGLTDRAVQRAIQSGRLEAYQCGKEVKVKGSDVRDWLVPS